MQILDINWGGDINIEIIFVENVPQNIKIGDCVRIQYDMSEARYYLNDGKQKYAIEAVGILNKNALEDYIKENNSESCLVGVIDVDKRNVTVKIHYFYNVIKFNKINEFAIKISDKVVSKTPRGRETLEYITEKFVYSEGEDNHIFVIGVSDYDSHKSEKSFTVVGRGLRLIVARINNEYVAVNMIRNSKEISAPISVFKGKVRFIDISESSEITMAQNACIDRVLNSSKYLQSWEAYNELEKFVAYKKAFELGTCEYTSYEVKITDVVTYIFNVKENTFAEQISEGLELDCTDDAELLNSIDSWEKLFQEGKKVKKNKDTTENGVITEEKINESRSIVSKSTKLESIYIGNFSKYVDGKIYIIDRYADAQKKLPKRGFLFNSIAGNKKMLIRRNQAKDLISNNKTPLRNLDIIINEGICPSFNFTDFPVITTEVKNKVKNKITGRPVEFNEDQIKAIWVAINSPDISLIQGPPGTGKTTVIKGIIARFEQLYKREHESGFPRILLTSFQHEAVENAIEDINTSGLPANRTGGKRGEDKKSESLKKWITETSEQIDKYIEEHGTPDVLVEVDNYRNEIFAWVSKGRDYFEGINLLNKYGSKHKDKLNVDLIKKIDVFVAELNIGKKKDINKVVDSENETAIKVLEKQRIDIVAFSDDGAIKAEDLEFEIELGTFGKIQVPECLKKVIATEGEDKKAFKDYVDFVNTLKKQFTKDNVETVVSIGQHELIECLNQLEKELEQIVLSKVENIEEAKCKILYEYKQAINYGGAEEVISKYSDITASSCQQSMEVGRFVKNPEYDLVIIDEAARANPLDLFIPMSMGKKVVLVGDQRQLPHMLEPDVVKALERTTAFSKGEDYTKSFFEKLFDKLEHETKDAINVRTYKLTKQYRMLPEISDFVRDEIYMKHGLDLTCDLSEETISERKLEIKEYNNKAVVWVNVGKKYGQETKEKSKSRDKEAEILISHLEKIVSRYRKIKSVGIITFYAKQVEILEGYIDGLNAEIKERLQIEIGTVDAFQGKEFDIVLLSCVRSNDTIEDGKKKQRVGFLDDENRLCVSLSRARNLMVAFGDAETVKCVTILDNYIKRCKEGKGCYIDA